ncbi:MAG: hypothetical protein JJ900_03690 [Rhodospirillales bacterium]|nr:hypothetical protein [Rhodospirillales bacterium]MBO6785928.1 hypothetical protein [Rhodospirillales bacterium]
MFQFDRMSCFVLLAILTLTGCVTTKPDRDLGLYKTRAIHSTILLVPKGIWEKGAFAKSLEAEYTNNGVTFYKKVSPEENFQDWTQLFEVKGWQTDKRLGSLGDSEIQIAKGRCQEDQFMIQPVENIPGKSLLILACGELHSSELKLPRSEISIILMYIHKGTFMRVMYRWRQRITNIKGGETIPVDEEQVRLMVRRFQAIPTS